MKLYFYTNKNVLFDYLGLNLIAPDRVVRDIKQFRTITTALDSFLFVTHKKLNQASREKGIAAPEFVYSIVLELSDPSENDTQAVLVSKCEDGYEYVLDELYNYDVDKHVGAYLIGEIPFSRIEKVYFNSQEEMDGFYRPSHDYWFPTSLFEILPEDFNEEFSFDPDEQKIKDAFEVDLDAIVSGIIQRERLRAGLLNFVNSSNGWQYDRYQFSLDKKLQNLFAIPDDSISDVLPHYLEVCDKNNVETIDLTSTKQDPLADINQKIFDAMRDYFSTFPFQAQKQPMLMSSILYATSKEVEKYCATQEKKGLIDRLIQEIDNLNLDRSNKTPEEIMADIPEPVDVLKALLFVVKNPNSYDLFQESLKAYHADIITKRRASVLWGLFNGLYGMPGEGSNKDNQKLWQFIEAYIYANGTGIKPTLYVPMPDMNIIDGVILGIPLKEARVLTVREIRDTLLTIPVDQLPKSVYEKLLEAAEMETGSKKKAQNKGYLRSVASIALPEIKIGEALLPETKKALEQLLKDFKNPAPNKEKLYKDYLETEDKFRFVVELDKEYWKKLFHMLRKNDA